MSALKQQLQARLAMISAQRTQAEQEAVAWQQRLLQLQGAEAELKGVIALIGIEDSDDQSES